MATEESPAWLLRRAADRLAELNKAAPPAPWRAYGGWVAAPVDACTCASPGGAFGHEPGCGFEQIAETAPMVAALMAALRPAAEQLAAWLREVAEYYAHLDIGVARSDDRATAIARAVLGETEPALLDHLAGAVDRARTARQPVTDAPFCRAGRRIDTNQAPTFEHMDDWSVCDHGRDVAGGAVC